MLSIGMFTYSTRPRGSVVHAASVADALARMGHRVTLYALAKPGAALYRDVACDVVLLPAREAPADMDLLVRQRVDEFVEGLESRFVRHDLLHAQDCLAASATLASSACRGSPLVRTVHHVERYESPYLADCQRRSIHRADEVFTVSRTTRREVTEYFGRSSRLVPNGVDLERFEGPLPSRRWLKDRFGLDAGARLVLSVGGVEPRKNSLRALAAFSRASETHPELAWVIAGGSSLWDHSHYAAEFEAHLAALPQRLRARILRAGPVSNDELTALYRLADVLLMPSLQEGFGLSVLESMGAGTPVIVPGEEPFTEYLDEDSASFVDPRSVEDIARALSTLARDPAARASLAASARERAPSFSWSRSALIHAEHYEAVVRPPLLEVMHA
jgi:glycosyltransferase-like protein